MSKRNTTPSKDQRGSRWVYVIVVAVVLVAVALIWPSTKTRSEVIKEHILNHPDDQWWLYGYTQNHGPEVDELLKKYEQQFVHAVRQYADLNDETRKITRLFLSRLSLGVESTPGHVTRLTNPEAVAVLNFIPKHVAAVNGSSVLQCVPNAKGDAVIAVWAVEIPPLVLAAAALHEMGHGLRQLNQNRGPDIPVDPPEEIDMHLLGKQVFDAGTQGEYGKLVNRIVNRSGGSDWRRAIDATTLEDYQSMDKILGADHAGRSIAGLLTFHLNLMTGIEAIDRSSLSREGKSAEKVKLYQFLLQSLDSSA